MTTTGMQLVHAAGTTASVPGNLVQAAAVQVTPDRVGAAALASTAPAGQP